MLGLPGLGTAGPVSHPPISLQEPLGPGGWGKGGRLGTAIVLLSCWPAYIQKGNWSSTSTWYNSAVGWLSWVDQLWPPSCVILAPPSFDCMKMLGLAGLIHMSW